MLCIRPYREIPEKSEINKDYIEQTDFITRRVYRRENKCKYIIEYTINQSQVLSARKSDIVDVSTISDIYAVGLVSYFTGEELEVIENISVEQFEFTHIDDKLVRISIFTDSDILSKQARLGKEDDKYYQIFAPSSELFWPESSYRKNSIEYLSTITRGQSYLEGNTIEVENNELSDGQAFKKELLNLTCDESTPINPSRVSQVEIPEGPKNRVPIIKGMLIYKLENSRKNKVNMKKFITEVVSRVFGTKKRTSSAYVNRLLDWSDDVKISYGKLYISGDM